MKKNPPQFWAILYGNKAKKLELLPRGGVILKMKKLRPAADGVSRSPNTQPQPKLQLSKAVT